MKGRYVRPKPQQPSNDSHLQLQSARMKPVVFDRMSLVQSETEPFFEHRNPRLRVCVHLGMTRALHLSHCRLGVCVCVCVPRRTNEKPRRLRNRRRWRSLRCIFPILRLRRYGGGVSLFWPLVMEEVASFHVKNFSGVRVGLLFAYALEP